LVENTERNQAQAKPSTCYARRHMSMAAAAYHDYALTVSWQSKVFYSNDRGVAEDFGVSPTTILGLRTWLEDRGWILPLDKGAKRKRNRVTGHYLPIRYRVLSHDEWVAAHPGHCRFIKPDPNSPAPDSAAGPASETVAGEQSPAPDFDSTCTSLPIPPASESGTKLCSKALYGESVKPSAAKNAAPLVLPEWIPVPEWTEFLKHRKDRKKPLNPYGQKLAIESLDKLRLAGHDVADAINRCILGGWSEFFPPKDTKDPNTRTERNLRAAGFARPGISFAQPEFSSRKPRSPETQAEIERIWKEHLEPEREK
jgi:hypothetical protein